MVEVSIVKRYYNTKRFWSVNETETIKSFRWEIYLKTKIKKNNNLKFYPH